ncbi:hypothetical protein PFISCL1PPCAC_7933, partial [Pristionchus fissidentatus]
RISAEKGLIITSVVAYVFYMLFFVNNVAVRYFEVFVCGYVQFLFLGLSAITPFCLIIFTASVRRFVFKGKRGMTITTVQSKTAELTSAEKGLIITSVVSYVFYMLYFVSNILARHFNVTVCGTSQFLFLGIASLTPFWCLLLFAPSVRRMAFKKELELSTNMYQALVLFDLCQTVFISACMIVTIPIAAYVYVKILVTKPFSQNYTFKLIVVNGISNILGGITYLIVIQLTSFAFMNGVYAYLVDNNLVRVSGIFTHFFDGIALHTALFIAYNRNESLFFFTSVILSIFLSSNRIVDLYFFTNQYYKEYDFGSGRIFFPRTEVRVDVRGFFLKNELHI